MTTLRDSGMRHHNQATGFVRDTEDSKVKFSNHAKAIYAQLEALDNAEYHKDDTELLDTSFRHEQSRGWVAHFPLIHPLLLNRLHQVLVLGAEKYSVNNWLKGDYLSRTFNSAHRHLADWYHGDTTEDHLGALAFNVMALMVHENMIQNGKLPAEFGDIGALAKDQKHFKKIDIT